MSESHDSQATIWLYVTVAVFVAVAFASGLYIGAQGSAGQLSPVISAGGAQSPQEADLTPLWETWNVIRDRYVPASTTDQISNEDLVYGAARGLTDALGDPYTVFLPPREAEVFEENISGNFEGVGMEVGARNGSLVIIAPLKGTPAERAGIQSGDRIIKIDDEPTDGMSIDEAVQRIRGERGTTITFILAREDERELLTVPVVRDVITIPTIQTELRSDDVFVIRLFNFSALSPGLFRGALREFVSSGSDKLVLDVRGNPGGFLEAAVDMASWFLPAGKVVVTEDLGDGESRIHRSRGYNIFDSSLKMAVLINGGTASASEILAGALQEHGVATLVGTDTFGKGSVQELVKIGNNASVKVTVARWLTPNGRSISEDGLGPDMEIVLETEDLERGFDLQLERAVEVLLAL